MRRVGLTDPLVEPLLAGLTREYSDRYGENTEMRRTTPAEFEPPSGLFVVLLDGAVTAAGGGYRRYSADTCEVKRMWTSPDYRRRGLAGRVLAALEEEAAAAGYTRLILETGPEQPEAEALYAGRGYGRIDFYGPYSEARAFAVDLVAGR